ncbi:MAG TPA: hypothetical protein PK205_11490 [Promineifilum sp.]|nr:hypothetical protein [Promineifilum sp.]HRO23615.1 hypothetical protein [Promineifilum sp.]HRO89394.1 hypothetical protein [Promineifilum sp.]HRQ13918.1 hypothetical protein [Promineifilum sp.]
MQISIRVVNNDALVINADVLVLKHAQALFGVDRKVVHRLSKLHANLDSSLPEYGKFLQVDSFGTIGVKEVLFVGVEQLFEFRYQNVREFAHRALAYLAKNSPQVETICFTLHGGGYGLDEVEAFESEIAGIVDALSKGEFPKGLKEIIIVELHKSLAEQLSQSLKDLFPQGFIVINKGNLAETSSSSSSRLKEAGLSSETKPLVFVAMPFDEKMSDVFHYGIRGAVNNAGYLCERVDQTHFTGDVMEYVKLRIRQADLVLADLTQANANVYLEVGYAWGCEKQTVLLVQDANELKFDVKSQRCLIYKSIRELEEMLHRELEKLPLKAK